jgi:hypothetical protein
LPAYRIVARTGPDHAPEFTVEVARPSSAPLVFGDVMEIDIKAAYLHGAPLVAGQVSYTLTRADNGFTPPGPEATRFTFGRGYGARNRRYRRHGGGLGLGGYGLGFGYNGGMILTRGAGQTDARGRLRVKHTPAAIEYAEGVTPPAAAEPNKDDKEKEPDPPSAVTYSVESEVTDQNNQAIAGRGSVVVHPATLYPGVRAARSVYKVG